MLLIGIALPLAMAVFGLLRTAPLRGRLLADAILLLFFSVIFAIERQNPLLFGSSSPKNGFWDQLLAAGWWLLAARLFAATLHFATGFDRRTGETRLFSDLLTGASYVAALLVVFNFVLRIPLTGLLATSGIVAIVIGLALQNTLADVFSGIAVGIERPFRIGDRIRLGERVEGKVVEINWRSIRVHTDDDDLAIIPNSMVAKSDLLNRSSLAPHRFARVEFSCTASVPPSHVERLARCAIALCPSLLDTPSATFLLLRVGERSNGYAIGFAVAESASPTRAKSALLRQVRRQLAFAGLLPSQPVDLLRAVPLFDCLDDERLKHVRDHATIRRIGPGESVFRQGDADANLYVVESGVIEIVRECDGVTSRPGRIGVGEYIGEIGLLTGAPRPVGAVALDDVVVRVLPYAALAPLLEREPDLAIAFEASVRRGRALLERDAVTRAIVDPLGDDHLLPRIRSFFGLG